jgi:hypothetical protein
VLCSDVDPLLHSLNVQKCVNKLPQLVLNPRPSLDERLSIFAPCPTSTVARILLTSMPHHHDKIERKLRSRKSAPDSREFIDTKTIKNKKELGLWAHCHLSPATVRAGQLWNGFFTYLIRPAKGLRYAFWLDQETAVTNTPHRGIEARHGRRYWNGNSCIYPFDVDVDVGALADGVLLRC